MRKKTLKLFGLALLAAFVLTACGRSGQVPDITSSSSGLWNQLVFAIAKMIKALSFGDLTGLGIVLFTVLLRLVLLPIYNLQIKSSQKMQAIQPELRELQLKYPGRDMDSRLQFSEAQQELYKQHGINPFASMWPLFVQMPILFALFQALTRVEFLRTGHFLWVEIAKPDPYFILPILAAGFTFLSTWLMNKAAVEKNGMSQVMMFIAPVMILLVALRMASGVTLYWTVSNACQVAQLLLFNNPFKVIAQREAEQQAIKEQAAKIRRAKKKAKKRK